MIDMYIYKIEEKVDFILTGKDLFHMGNQSNERPTPHPHPPPVRKRDSSLLALSVSLGGRGRTDDERGP